MPFKSEFNIKVEDFTEGALHAVETITQHVAEGGDIDILNDRLTPSCLQKLEDLNSLDAESRSNALIRKGDVFLSWVAASLGHKGGLDSMEILFVTMSFKDMEKITQIYMDNKKRTKTFMEELREQNPDPLRAKEMIDDFKSTMVDPHKAFKESDILISNFKFVYRDGGWLVDQFSLKPGRDVISPLYYFRWKGRVGLSVRGLPFMSHLRVDYLTDYLVMFGIFFFIISKLG